MTQCRKTAWLISGMALFLAAAVLAACSSSAAPTPTPGAKATPATPAPGAQPTPTRSPGSITPPPTVPAQSDLLKQGELIFQKTAGGVGCQSCHGPDAKGMVGPNIRGKTVDDIKFQLAINPQMGFVVLSDGEIEAVAAYLQFLLTQP